MDHQRRSSPRIPRAKGALLLLLLWFHVLCTTLLCSGAVTMNKSTNSASKDKLQQRDAPASSMSVSGQELMG